MGAKDFYKGQRQRQCEYNDLTSKGGCKFTEAGKSPETCTGKGPHPNKILSRVKSNKIHEK